MPNPKKKGKKLEPEQVDGLQEAYTKNNTAALLEDTFGKFEKATSSNSAMPDLDRADHIIIGGRTATELLVEKFNQEFPTVRNPLTKETYSEYQRSSAYTVFYKQKGKDYVNQMVSEALAKGEEVKVFVPDKVTGKIQKDPMKLTHTGYEPTGSLAKPAQLNRWQRFWNKLGFYKKEKAAVVNYEKEMALRNKVQFCNKASRALMTSNYNRSASYQAELEKYHPDIVEDMKKNFPTFGKGTLFDMGEANGWRTSRSSFISTAMCYLATRRDENGKLLYTNEQLFDLTDPKMQKARADALKEVYEHYKPGALLKQEMLKKQEAEAKGEKYENDSKLPNLQAEAKKAQDWLVDLQHDEADVMRERISEQGSKLDLSKPDLTEQEGYQVYGLLSDTAFEQSQDLQITKKRMDEKYGKGAYWAATGKLGDCCQPSREFAKSLSSQKALLNGIPGKNVVGIMEELGNVFKAQAIQQKITQNLKENPGMKFADACTADDRDAAYKAGKAAEYEDDLINDARENGEEIPRLMQQSIDLANEQIKNPEQFGRQIQNGVLERRLKLEKLAPYGSEEPSRFEIRDAKTVEREMKREREQEQRVDDARCCNGKGAQVPWWI